MFLLFSNQPTNKMNIINISGAHFYQLLNYRVGMFCIPNLCFRVIFSLNNKSNSGAPRQSPWVRFTMVVMVRTMLAMPGDQADESLQK